MFRKYRADHAATRSSRHCRPPKTITYAAEIAFGSGPDGAATVPDCVAAFFKSFRYRTRRAIFCFRTRLNRDLSPLIPDMMNSCYCGDLN